MTTVPILRDYLPEDNAAALELEAQCVQGRKFSLSFWRPYFHRRAEGFACWRILTAWQGSALVAIGGAAIKPVVWNGRETAALYLFDFRVAPEQRRSGIGRTLAEALIDWARPQAEFGYAYAVGDNEAIAKLADQWLGAPSSHACSYLAYPTYKAKAPSHGVTSVAPAETHARYIARAEPFGFYSRPVDIADESELIGSWHYRGDGEAGCSAWNNAEILREVVAGLPLSLRIAGQVLNLPLLKRFGLPHVPLVGEKLRSWYLFDFHADSAQAARGLIGGVAAQARAAGIDYCYIIHSPGQQKIVAQLRESFPAAIAPIVPFSVMARTLSGEPLRIDAPYIDIRDM